MQPSDAETAVRAAAIKPRRLTRAEAAKVRSLVADDGFSRAEADAWVRTFGASDEWHPAEMVSS